MITAQENAPSLEVVRKVTELGVIPDVLSYGPRARFAEEISTENWWRVLQRPGVQVGRSDLRVDPSAYRAEMAMQLAELFHKERELTERLRATIPERNIRRAEADLSAHLEAGELDYGWTYENLARSPPAG